VAEFDVVAARLCGEGEGGVEVGEGAVDGADAAEGVGRCEVGRGEGGEVEAEAARGVEVEESCVVTGWSALWEGGVGWAEDVREITSGGGGQGAVGVVSIPVGGFVEGVLHVVHEA